MPPSSTELDSADWSDSDAEEKPDAGSSVAPLSQVDAAKKIKKLEAQLSQAHDNLQSFRSTIKERFDLLQVAGVGSGSRRVSEPRDDDTHYFDSYSYNGNAVWLSIHVRIGR